MDLSKNTSDDGLGRDKHDDVEDLTPEEMARNDLWDISPYFISLYWNEPFFATIYQYVNRLQDRKLVPTAGVAVHNDRPTLLWNPDFTSKLSYREVMGLLKHEAYHLIYSHCTTRRHTPHFVWNWATDLSINTSLEAEELPKGGLVPGKPLCRPSDKAWEKMSEKHRARFEKLSSLIASFPPEKYAEWYFASLLEDPEVQEMVQEAADAEALGKLISEAIGKGISDAMNGSDSHEGWGKSLQDDGTWKDLPDGVRQLLEGEIRDAVREAVNRADGGNRWGSVPSAMQRELRSLVSTEVDWRQVLRQFVGMSQRGNSKTSWKKVNRKIPYMAPGRARSYTANIAVFVDQSGSVDDASLELGYGELRSLAKRTTFTFFPFDYTVDTENSFVWKKNQTKANLTRFRAGGTSFQACVDHVNANKDKFDGVIIITDGECDKPSVCCRRLAYLIVPGRNLCFAPYPDNVVITMKHPEKGRD